MAKAPATIRQRGNGWQVVIRLKGKRYQFGPRSDPFLGTNPTRKEVEEWAWRKHAELKESSKREVDGLPDSIHFSELVEQFRAEEMPILATGTQRAYEETLRPVEEYFGGTLGDPLLTSIRKRHIKAYLSWRRVNRRNGKEPLSNRTLVKDRAVLHRLFDAAEDWEYREGNPVGKVKPPKCDDHDPVILTDDQYEALLRECEQGGPMLHLYALVLGETGARAYSEALHIQWDDVDLEDGFVRLVSGRDGHRLKSGKGRFTPMTPRLRQAMREHFAAFRFAAYDGQRSPWVFHHSQSRVPVYWRDDRRLGARRRHRHPRGGYYPARDRSLVTSGGRMK